MANTFNDIKAKLTIEGAFSDVQKTSILSDLETAYNGSSIAKQMFDDWIATAGHTINITFSAGNYQAWANEGKVEIDPNEIIDRYYISDKGTAVLDTQLTALTHELGHALTGKDDNWEDNKIDYQGDNVRFVNTIWDQLGLAKQISYIAYAGTDLLKPGYTYTNNKVINAAITKDGDMNSSDIGRSDDLLIGGPSNNNIQSGEGNDFLFGAGGNDTLSGGEGLDTAVYFGSPLDYDIRKNTDGSWTVKNVRGSENAALRRI